MSRAISYLITMEIATQNFEMECRLPRDNFLSMALGTLGGYVPMVLLIFVFERRMVIVQLHKKQQYCSRIDVFFRVIQIYVCVMQGQSLNSARPAFYQVVLFEGSERTNSETRQFFEGGKNSGILGAGWSQPKETVGPDSLSKKQNDLTFFQSAMDQILLDRDCKRIFGVQSCAVDHESVTFPQHGGYLDFGYANESRYEGEFEYASVEVDKSNSFGSFCIEMTQVDVIWPEASTFISKTGAPQRTTVSSQDLTFPGKEDQCQTIVDTGNNRGMIFVPEAYGQIWGAYYGVLKSGNQKIQQQSFAGGLFGSGGKTVGNPNPDPSTLCITQNDLNQMPTMHITFKGGGRISIPPESMFSFGGPKSANGECGKLRISFLDNVQNNNLGQSLLQSYYTVFDREENQVGFAKSVGCPKVDEYQEEEEEESV